MVEEDADGSSERLSRAAASVAPFAALKRERKGSSLLVGGPTVIYIPRTMTSMPKKRVHEEGPAQQRSPQKRFASKETLFSRGASRERFSRTKTRQRDRERERETPRFDVRLVVANAISVLLSSRW